MNNTDRTVEQGLAAMRAAYRNPRLDTDAIMAAVLGEASVRPARRASAVRRTLPSWVSACAACAALMWCGAALWQARGAADQQIGVAWMNSIDAGAMASELSGNGGDEAMYAYWR
jgi:hypothetical protein